MNADAASPILSWHAHVYFDAARTRDRAERCSRRAEPIRLHPRVSGFRHLGMIWAFEVSPAKPGFAREFFAASLKRGVLLRPIGNTVYFMPPYVISDDEFSLLVTQTLAVIDEVTAT